MRAGLLSQPEVIRGVNERFVSTTITVFDLRKLAQSGDELAGKVFPKWSNPVSLMFLTSSGEFVSLLNPVREFTDVHPDTGLRRGQAHDADPRHNTQVFLRHVDDFFNRKK